MDVRGVLDTPQRGVLNLPDVEGNVRPNEYSGACGLPPFVSRSRVGESTCRRPARCRAEDIVRVLLRSS